MKGVEVTLESEEVGWVDEDSSEEEDEACENLAWVSLLTLVLRAIVSV